MVLVFDDFALDPDGYELRRSGTPIAMEPQVFDVLTYLVRHADRLVTKEELLDNVWGDRFVSESALTSRIKEARRALGDDGRAQRYLKTVHGRGYRFVAEVSSATGSPGDAERAHRRRARGLPQERTPLLGRDGELAEVTGLLTDHRLVTLLAIGGTGKTRLAVAVGHRADESFPDGVAFVDLAPVDDRRSVLTAIANGVDVGLDVGEAIDGLAGLLDGRETLVVLDNCEHVAGIVAPLLDELLERTSGPRFLATSRLPLGLRDEQRMILTPLAVDGVPENSPATQLFVLTARRLGLPEPGPHELVESVCSRLDGLPLAIELAAAQLGHITLAELAAHLDERFELLRTDGGGDRQSSLGAVLSGTWEMMGAGEHELVGRLAVFPGGFGLDDVAGVSPDRSIASISTDLARLADRSLIVHDPAEPRGRRLLETVRLFARRRVGDDVVRSNLEAHAAWCLDRAGSSPTDALFDWELAVWSQSHHDDIRVAERHLVDARRPEDAARLAAATSLGMHIDDGTRAREMFERLGEHLDRIDDGGLAARLHLTAVMCGMATRSPDVIDRHGRLAVDLAAGDSVTSAVALVLASWSTIFTDGERALTMVRRAGDLADAAGSPRARALADGYLGYYLAALRRWDESEAAVAISVEEFDARIDYPACVAATAQAACRVMGDPTGCLPWADRIADLPTPRYRMWASQVLVASIHASNGHAAETFALVDEVDRRLTRSGQSGFPDLLVPAAILAHRRGDDDRAIGWLWAVRTADRPTQSFQATVLYRRATDTIGGGRRGPVDDRSIDDVGAEALSWLAGEAEAEHAGAGAPRASLRPT